MKKDQKRWDERYRGRGFVFPKGPHPFLKKHFRLLPKGRALDLAAGEGRNAIFLAEKGFEVDAVDISEVALKKARQWAREKGVKIRTVVGDLDSYIIGEASYDVILNFYFLRRRLIPKIKRGLNKGGKVVFETYLLEQRSIGVAGPKNPRYFLKPNELLNWFRDFRVLVYREGVFREDGRKKAIASLVAEKI